MIPFKSFLGFKKVDKETWLAERLKELEKEFEAELSTLDEECKQIISLKEHEKEVLEKALKKVEMERFEQDELWKRVNDKKIELVKKNKELAEQIRLIEAKASPDNVWLSAFQTGFTRAWEMMKPIMYTGFDKVKQEISDNAKMETLNGLQSVLGRGNGVNPEKD